MKHLLTSLTQSVLSLYCAGSLIAMRHDPYNTPQFRRMVANIKQKNTTALKELLDSAIWTTYDKANEDKIRQLIRDGANPNCVGQQHGNNALMFACRFGNPSLAEFLLCNGADPNRINNLRQNALIYSLISGGICLNILTSLIKHNLNINYRDPSGKDALRYAIQYGHPHAADLLVTVGVDPEAIINGKNAYQTSDDASNQNARLGPIQIQSAFFKSIGTKAKIK